MRKRNDGGQDRWRWSGGEKEGIENESNGRKARRCECFLKDNRDGNKIAKRRRRKKGILMKIEPSRRPILNTLLHLFIMRSIIISV